MQEKLYRFMYGRYGVDQMCWGLLILYFLITGVNSFLGFWPLQILGTLVFVFAIYRMMSRKIALRQKENVQFLKFLSPIRRWLSLQKRKFVERKTHCYHKCPACKALLRLPRRKGRHTVSCPRCRKEFRVRNYY